MSPSTRVALVILVIAAGGIATAWGLLRALEAPPVVDGEPEPVEFRVDSGEGFATVARRLEHRGLVISAFRLRVLARLERVDRDIRAGTYVFVPGATPREILQDLVSGRVRLLRFTVPEGKRVEQIAALAERELGVAAADFEAAATDSVLLARVDSPASSLEGYLFPETYFFPDGAEASEVVATMVERFEEVWASLDAEPPLSWTRHETLTLASIVEAETKIPAERARVAAVYRNRLENGWRLQADPTVRYALQRFRGRLYYKHLEVDSPYNTYRNYGLPPGPINSPGLGAIAAALNPLEDCEDFFFVASGNGGHTFSRTKSEHDAARQRARAARERR